MSSRHLTNLISFKQYNVTSHTLNITDQDCVIEMSNISTNTVIVPLNSSVPFEIGTQIIIVQKDIGQTQIVPQGGVTINSNGGALNLSNQYASAVLTKRGTDEWYLWGDIIT